MTDASVTTPTSASADAIVKHKPRRHRRGFFSYTMKIPKKRREKYLHYCTYPGCSNPIPAKGRSARKYPDLCGHHARVISNQGKISECKRKQEVKVDAK